MIKWFNSLFKRKKKMAKKFDIVVYDIGENGSRMNPQPQNGVMAPSRQDVYEMFEACGQQVEIQREYEDDQSKNYGKFDPSKLKTDYQQGGPLECKSHMDSNLPKEVMDAVLNPTAKTTSNQPPQNTTVTNTTVPPLKMNEPPKYFTVGGMKCKIENGKVYQKQWLRISDDEMSEIRIVSDKNNKICPLKDKHIEILKWVQTEDSESSEDKTEKGLLLG